MLALIDGDIVAFRASVVHKKEVDWDSDGDITQSISIPAAIETAKDLTRSWAKEAGANKILVCFSPRDGNTFRKHIIPGYKQSRPEDKPDAYWPVVDAMESEFDYLRMDGLEADDVLGLVSTNPRTGPAVIVTADKDMQCIPGFYFRPGRDDKPRRITQQTADYFWMVQTLMGDPSDGYKGCPGIGVKKAQAALADVQRTVPAMWPVVLEMFLSKEMTIVEAITQARASRILRYGDYDEQNKRIKLWGQSTAYINLPLPALPDLRQSTPTPPRAASRPLRRSSRTPVTSE